MSVADALQMLWMGRNTEKDIVEFLQEKCKYHHIDISTYRDQNEWTILHWAAQDGLLELATLCLKNGCNVNHKDKFGATPIMLAAHNGRVEVMKLFINGKEEDGVVTRPIVMEGNNFQTHALIYAILRDHIDICDLLLAAAPDVIKLEDKVGDTPLHHACQHGNHDMVKYLLEKGADVNTQNNVGETALEQGKRLNKLSERTITLLEAAHVANPVKEKNADEIRGLVADLLLEEARRKKMMIEEDKKKKARKKARQEAMAIVEDASDEEGKKPKGQENFLKI